MTVTTILVSLLLVAALAGIVRPRGTVEWGIFLVSPIFGGAALAIRHHGLALSATAPISETVGPSEPA